MTCYIPKHSGFCFGVDLAVKAAYENLNNYTYMYGEVVHNPSVIIDLKNKGLGLIESLDEVSQKKVDNVLIRAHGVPENIIIEARDKGLGVIDKTCPRVKKVHDIVANASNRGLDVIIVGTPKHPEVVGIEGWVHTQTIVLRDVDDAERIIPKSTFPSVGVCLVAQTTHNKAKYEDVYAYCKSILPNIDIEFHDTICDATAVRQGEIRNLATTVDSVIVIGGKTSSNVTKLYEIASEYNNKAYHVESSVELDMSQLFDVSTILIASGASTPENSIAEVIEHLRQFCNGKNEEFELIELT